MAQAMVVFSVALIVGFVYHKVKPMIEPLLIIMCIPIDEETVVFKDEHGEILPFTVDVPMGEMMNREIECAEIVVKKAWPIQVRNKLRVGGAALRIQPNAAVALFTNNECIPLHNNQFLIEHENFQITKTKEKRYRITSGNMEFKTNEINARMISTILKNPPKGKFIKLVKNGDFVTLPYARRKPGQSTLELAIELEPLVVVYVQNEKTLNGMNIEEFGRIYTMLI